MHGRSKLGTCPHLLLFKRLFASGNLSEKPYYFSAKVSDTQQYPGWFVWHSARTVPFQGN